MRGYLQQRGLIGLEIEPFHPRTRDRADIPVLRCRTTGVMFLDEATADLDSHYVGKQAESDGLTSTKQLGDTKVTTASLTDAARRAEQFRNLFVARDVCDFGTGHGLFLRHIKPVSRSVAGVELNRRQVADLVRDGFRIEASIEAFAAPSFDAVTLFHVLEHLSEPVEMLAAIRSRMRPGARLILEVPHARDFLHQTLESEAFKAFTFWSEHLVLHTRESLRRTIELAGFSQVVVKGFQRYGLENHLHWLVRQKPGGHQEWTHLSDDAVNRAYGDLLQSIDQTDTLTATASA